MTTGFVWHEIYMWHDTGTHAGVMPPGGPVQPYEHAENPETKRRIRNLLEVSGLLDKLAPVTAFRATEEQLLRVHTKTVTKLPHCPQVVSLQPSMLSWTPRSTMLMRWYGLPATMRLPTWAWVFACSVTVP